MSNLYNGLQEYSDQELFFKAVAFGLSQEQKKLPTSYLYDARGSELFEEITKLDEYYQTRAEISILNNYAREWTARLSQGTALVEFGSGSSIKTEILLSASELITSYVPIDVSESALISAKTRLSRSFPELKIIPLVGDFTSSINFQELEQTERAGFFPGSTIGNWEPDQARLLLRSFARLLGQGSRLLIGIDLIKDPKRLVSAYNDSSNITALFNLNLLHRINRELGGSFNLNNFKHTAVFNEEFQRVEMHLVSLRVQSVKIRDKKFDFCEGETVHTENSYKYNVDNFQNLVRSAGWLPESVWIDSENLFSVHSLSAT